MKHAQGQAWARPQQVSLYAVQDDPAKLHVTNSRSYFVDVITAPMLKEVPHDDPVVAVNGLEGDRYKEDEQMLMFKSGTV